MGASFHPCLQFAAWAGADFRQQRELRAQLEFDRNAVARPVEAALQPI
jgi:hypothetical protein